MISVQTKRKHSRSSIKKLYLDDGEYNPEWWTTHTIKTNDDNLLCESWRKPLHDFDEVEEGLSLLQGKYSNLYEVCYTWTIEKVKP